MLAREHRAVELALAEDALGGHAGMLRPGTMSLVFGRRSIVRAHRPIVVVVEAHRTEDAVGDALPGYALRRLDPSRPDDNTHLVATPRP